MSNGVIDSLRSVLISVAEQHVEDAPVATESADEKPGRR